MQNAPADPKRPVMTGLIPLLRLEGLAIGLAAVAAYAVSGAGWLPFALLILAPDLAIAGYAFGPRTGAIAYNAAHTYIGPVALGVAGWLAGWPMTVPLAAIWIAHIGLDRAIGYGLKHRSGFKTTHLSVADVR
jgi:hypothetical protein